MIAFLIGLFCERALQKRLYLCELLQRATVLRLFDVCCATAQSSLDWFEGDLDAGRASVSMYSSKCIQAILCISKCIQAMHSIAWIHLLEYSVSNTEYTVYSSKCIEAILNTLARIQCIQACVFKQYCACDLCIECTIESSNTQINTQIKMCVLLVFNSLLRATATNLDLCIGGLMCVLLGWYVCSTGNAQSNAQINTQINTQIKMCVLLVFILSYELQLQILRYEWWLLWLLETVI